MIRARRQILRGHRPFLSTLFIERMELNEELFTHYISKPELQELVSKWLGSKVYERLSTPATRGKS